MFDMWFTTAKYASFGVLELLVLRDEEKKAEEEGRR